MERRDSLTHPVNVEERADGKKVITGYAAVFFDPANSGTQYELSRNTQERISSRAFDAALASDGDVIAAFNHNPERVLGRRSSGTLRLSKDAVGLRYEVDVNPEDPEAMSVVAKIKRGDLRGSSFAFRVADGGQRWANEGEQRVRMLENVHLYDVGPVTNPAYGASTTGLRAVGETQEAEAAAAAWEAEKESVSIRLRLLELDL
jgi:HK97 family phage prohead protease